MSTFDNYLKINSSLSYIGYNYNAAHSAKDAFPRANPIAIKQKHLPRQVFLYKIWIALFYLKSFLSRKISHIGKLFFDA
jgi:hypothetical protein